MAKSPKSEKIIYLGQVPAVCKSKPATKGKGIPQLDIKKHSHVNGFILSVLRENRLVRSKWG